MLKILIVNYNTQRLTECAIKSVNKHTPDCHIFVLDNSDKEPFVNTFDNVTVLDNTKKQYFDIDAMLEKYPNRSKSPGYLKGALPSARHCYSVDQCMDIIGDNFVLLDSDVLVKRDLHELVDDTCIFVGEVVLQPLQKTIKRVLPFVCYINVKMCKEHGVRYFDDNYMHGLVHQKVNINSDKYDTGAGFYVHASKYKHKLINHKEYVFHFKGGSWDDKATRTAGKYKNDEEFLNKFRRLWDTSYKKVIYTCISGNYDRLKEPQVLDPDFDYVCFTDQRFDSPTWNMRPIPEELKNLSQVKRQRCIKLLPHKYLPEFDVSVWVDSNVDIKNSVRKYMEDNNINHENGYLFVGEHPRRKCIYEEAKECLRLKKDVAENVNPQMDDYRKEGMPENFGLPQTCILFRYHNDERAKLFGEAWFNEVKNRSHRDQLSFSYAAWKVGMDGIVYLPSTIFTCETFRWGAAHTPVTKTPGTVVNKRSEPVSPKKNNNLTVRVRDILEQRRRSRINAMTL